MCLLRCWEQCNFYRNYHSLSFFPNLLHCKYLRTILAAQELDSLHQVAAAPPGHPLCGPSGTQGSCTKAELTSAVVPWSVWVQDAGNLWDPELVAFISDGNDRCHQSSWWWHPGQSLLQLLLLNQGEERRSLDSPCLGSTKEGCQSDQTA